jgi:hypothetical protein
LKLTKYRRLAIAMVGAGALALIAGPATAHQHNGNPLAPNDPVNGRHDVIVESGGVPKTVSLVRSKVDGCVSNTAEYTPPAPACATPSIVDISAPNFNGTANQAITVLLCNAKRAAGTDQGGDNDPTGGCDIGNGKGLENPPAAVAGSGTFALDANGDLTGGVGNVPANGKIPLTLTSCNGNATTPGTPLLGLADGLTPLGASEPCENGNATTTCPPTQGQISSGWTCIVTVAEFTGLSAGAHVGFRQLNMKSPIPTKLCDLPPTNGVFVACGTTIPAGQPVQLSGVRFPCKTIQPDDPAVTGNQAACQVAHTNKTVLVKRNSTSAIEFSVTPTSQTAGLNGDYTVTFNMPNVAVDGELYKLVPHAQDCTFSQGSAGFAPPNDWRVKTCESGKFNAAGPSVKQ